MPRRILAACLLLLLAALPARAADIAIEQPWARAAMQGGVGGAFMRLSNAGATADRLLAVASPAARAVEMHTTIQDGDVMRMRPVGMIDLPAGGAVQLQPGGLHLMLMGLNRPLNPGETVAVTLTFERAGAITVEIPVRAAGAMAHGAMRH
jgi:copper(I)-binding protein